MQRIEQGGEGLPLRVVDRGSQSKFTEDLKNEEEANESRAKKLLFVETRASSLSDAIKGKRKANDESKAAKGEMTQSRNNARAKSLAS